MNLTHLLDKKRVVTIIIPKSDGDWKVKRIGMDSVYYHDRLQTPYILKNDVTSFIGFTNYV